MPRWQSLHRSARVYRRGRQSRSGWSADAVRCCRCHSHRPRTEHQRPPRAELDGKVELGGVLVEEAAVEALHPAVSRQGCHGDGDTAGHRHPNETFD